MGALFAAVEMNWTAVAYYAMLFLLVGWIFWLVFRKD